MTFLNLILLLITSFFCKGHASEARPIVDYLENIPSEVLEVKNAVFRFRTPKSGFGGPQCSGTFISNDGHFLTALHCLDLEAPNIFLTRKIPLGGGFIYSVSLKSDDAPIIDQPLLDMTQSNPRIVMIGSGRQFLFVDNSKLNNRDRSVTQAVLEDFAILKFDLKQKVSCAKIATRSLEEKEIVYGFGYPWFSRNVFSPENSNLYVSKGPFLKNYSYTSQEAIVKPGEPVYYKNKIVDIKGFYNPDRYGFAKMGARGGMSGGGVFDSNGNIVGVFEAGSDLYSHFVYTSHIQRKVSRIMGPRTASKIFACD